MDDGRKRPSPLIRPVSLAALSRSFTARANETRAAFCRFLASLYLYELTDEQIEASVEFLKWITEPENNISFSVGSGYMPVTHAACDMDAIEQSGLPLSGSMKEILSTAIDTVNSCELYTMPAFTGAKDARSILESCMSDRASADRRTVEERLAAGQSAADAEAEFLTDGCFENWYNETLEKLRSCEG